MTEEQKEMLIAKMLDAPTSLSDKELEAIIQDDELRDIYELSASVERAIAPGPELDLAKEWVRFRPRLRPRPSFSKRFMRVAAIFLGIVFASSIAVKVVDNMFTGNQKIELAQANPQPSPSSAQATAVNESAPAVEVSTALPESKTDVTSKPHVAKQHPAKTKKSALNMEQETIDVDEYLRIQQAMVDNEIALLQAEMMADQQPSLYGTMYYEEEGQNTENFRLTIMQ